MPISEIRRRGLMLVLSSPSGAGKTKISRILMESDPNITLSVSLTTRPQRPTEVDGVDYIFVDDAKFAAMADSDALLEDAMVFGHRYGTPRDTVETALHSGRDMLFDIDWQGAQALAQRVRGDLVRIFILPPSMAELERRLKSRAEDTDGVVAARMDQAQSEISHWAEYEYVIVNDKVDSSVAAVQAILTAERLRRSRRIGLLDFVKSLDE